ncbi:8324_t:CDS:2, partial [Paraglomus occultum]
MRQAPHDRFALSTSTRNRIALNSSHTWSGYCAIYTQTSKSVLVPSLIRIAVPDHTSDNCSAGTMFQDWGLWFHE